MFVQFLLLLKPVFYRYKDSVPLRFLFFGFFCKKTTKFATNVNICNNFCKNIYRVRNLYIKKYFI